MHLEILWHGETTEAHLANGKVSVGGGLDDGVRLEGLPEALLLLTVDEAMLSVTSTQTVLIGSAPFPPHVPSLAVEGEAVLIEGVELRRPRAPVEARQKVDTAFVTKALLQGDFVPSQSRAATMTCVAGADLGRIYPLAFTQTLLGRASEVDLQLHDAAVSRHHAKLMRRGAQFTIEPCRSTNGVFVNGRPIRRATKLASGDVVELGQTMLRFDAPVTPFEEATVLMMPEPTLELPSITVPRRARSVEAWLMALSFALALIGIAIAWAASRSS